MRKLLSILATAILTACGGGSDAVATTATATDVCVNQGVYFYCETANSGFVKATAPVGYFVRSYYDQSNTDLEFNGIAYRVGSKFYLRGSNEFIGAADQYTLVEQTGTNFYVKY